MILPLLLLLHPSICLSQLRPTSIPIPISPIRLKREHSTTNFPITNQPIDVNENAIFPKTKTFDVSNSIESVENEEKEKKKNERGKEDELCTSDKTIIENLLDSYNSFKTPSESGVTVWIEVWVQEVNAVNEITSDFDMDIYVTELWIDDALRYEHLNPCKYNLSLNSEILEKIWKPNTVFINSKSAHIHMSPFKNVFLMIYPNGTVWVNYRVQVKGPCSMDFSSFPMDYQTCYLTLESFSYNNKEVDMQWTNSTSSPLSLLKEEIVLPDFVLSNYSTYIKEEIYPAGMWNELTMTFTFTRRYGWYIFQAYIPTYLTIFISWISFCLGAKMMPARTMLGVNSLLALTFQFGNIMRNLPRVSYVKALDVWMLVCLTFVFCSLLELAIVGSISSRIENKQKMDNQSIYRLNGNGPTHSALLERLQQFDKKDKSFGSSLSPRICRHKDDEEVSTLPISSQTSSHPNYGTLNDEKDSLSTNVKSVLSRRTKRGDEDRHLLVEETSFSPQIQNVFNGHFIRKERRSCWSYILSHIPSYSTDQIDRFSIWLFPSLFAIFNIIYWSYYLSRSQ